MATTIAPDRPAGAASLRQPSAVAHGPTVTVERLLRWTGAANILAGLLTVAGNVLHPPRSFATLSHDALLPAWETVHALGVVAFVVTLFALIGLYACQVERAGRLDLAGFVGALTGVALAVGVLVPDAFIFPVLAQQDETARLLEVPGALIPGSTFGRFLAVSGVVYALGYVTFGVASLRAGVLPRWGVAVLTVGVVPLLFGALVAQGLDIAGALLVGAGHVWCGVALWRGHATGQAVPESPRTPR